MAKNKVYHEHDVGYKHIFSHKGTFLEFLRSFTKKEWANLIKEEDLASSVMLPSQRGQTLVKNYQVQALHGR